MSLSRPDFGAARVNRRTLLLAGTTLSFTTLAAPSLVRAQTKSLRVASLLPRSGFLAQAGQSCHRGALAAQALLTELGHAIEIVHIDTESNVETARTQAERAINEGVQALVGPFESGAALAIAQVCEQRKVPFIVNIAAAPQLTEQGYQFLVRNFQTGGQLVANGLKLIASLLDAQKLSYQSAVFLHANDTFGTAQRGAMDALFPKANLPFKLLESIAYDPRAQDLSVEVTRLRSLNPDIVMVVTRAGDAVKLVRDMVRQRFEPKAIISPGSPGLYDEEFFQTLGPLSDFMIYNVPWVNPKSAMTSALEKAFAKANPSNRFAVDCLNAGFTFEAFLIAADAFKRGGTSNGPELMAAIRASNITEHVMTGGPITFDAKGQNPNIASVSVQNIKRTPTVVLPADIATTAPVMPMPGWQGRS